MTTLEERLRRVLRYYDPVQPPETALAHPEPRLLTDSEPTLPVGLKEPYGPDERVFGDPRGPKERGTHRGWPFIACTIHQCGWDDPGGCWCCKAGIPAVAG